MSCPRCMKLVAVELLATNAVPPPIGEVIPDSVNEDAVQHLPDDVKGYYNSARRALDAGLPDAAAVQLRRTLEAAAAHHNVSAGPLMQRIRRLISDGLITKDFSRVLHHVRKLGNIGAHAGDETVDDVAARQALRFTTQVLRNLFEIPKELEAMGLAPAGQEPDE